MAGSKPEQQSADMRAPSGAAVPTAEDRLNGTGTSEDTNATSLTVGEMATIKVGGVAIRINFLSATGGGSSCATTDLILGPYDRMDWLVSSSDCFVAVEAADGAAAYEAWVWTSSGKRA